MDTRKTFMLGIKRVGLLALLAGLAFWPSLTGGRTKPAASPDAPATFHRAAQLEGPFDVSALVVNESELYAATGGACGDRQGAGIFRSSDNGQSWTPLDDGVMSTSVRSLMVGNSGALFVGTRDGVFRSANFGNTWSPTGLLGVDISAMTSGPEVLFAADGCQCSGIYRSTDEGDSWQKVGEGLEACVKSVAIDPEGAVFAATADHGVYRSTDNGDNWAPANTGLTTLVLKTVAADADGHLFIGSSDGVFRSTDGGASWARMGLSGLRVNTLAIQTGAGILAGTDTAVYRSTDGGYSWNSIDLELSDRAKVRALVFGEHGMAFAASGRDVLRTTLATRGGGAGTAAIQIASPTVDSVVSTSGNTVASLSWSHTVGNADPNTLLVVRTSNDSNKTVTNVTYRGTTMIRSGFLGNGNKNRVEIWTLVGPTAGPGTVAVSLSGAVDVVAGSTSFYGVDQATPLGTFASASGSTVNPSVFVTFQSGAAVVDVLAADGDAGTATEGAGQTPSQWNITTGPTSADVRAAGSIKTAGGTSATMSWTLGLAKAWSLVAIAVNGVGAVPACVLGYPAPETGFPRSNVVFSENPILRGVQGPPNCEAGDVAAVIAYYNDEHAITLGVRRVIVITSKTCSGGTSPGSPCTANNSCGKGGTCVGNGTTTDYPVAQMNGNPDHAVLTSVPPAPPPIGTTATTGDQAGLDVNTCPDPAHPTLSCGRPMWPALYVTDITNDPTSRAGDWQHYGTPNNPSDIFGTWKAAVRIVDNTVPPTNANAVNVVPDPDPVKNNWNLGPGSDPAPPGLVNEGYGAEIRWNLAGLRDNTGALLQRDHRYRLQVIIHDGDQNKVGGDIGQGCAIATFDERCLTPPTPTPTPPPTGADLSIEKLVTPTSVCINGTSGAVQTSCSTAATGCSGTLTDLTYTITATNNGPLDADSVVITDTLPQYTSFVSCVTDPVVTCTNNSGTVTADFGTVPLGQLVKATIVVSVNGNAILNFNNTPGNPQITQIPNTASVASATPDPDPNNNSSTIATSVTYCTVSGTNLSITKASNPECISINYVSEPAIVGKCDQNAEQCGAPTAPEDIKYTILVANTGPGTASSVTVTDALPPYKSFFSCKFVNPSNPNPIACPDGSFANGTVTVNLGTLLLNETGRVEITVTVDGEAMFQDGAAGLSDTANVSWTDPSLKNKNSDPALTSVVYCTIPFARYRPNER